MTNKPIYIVDDDYEDEEIIIEAFNEIGINNDVIFFRDAESVIAHLRTTKEVPFIILSEVVLPKMDGFKLRELLLKEISSERSIPFIFWSTSASPAQIKKAYELSAHGFFLKGKSFSDLKTKIKEMVSYWNDSLVP